MEVISRVYSPSTQFQHSSHAGASGNALYCVHRNCSRVAKGVDLSETEVWIWFNPLRPGLCSSFLHIEVRPREVEAYVCLQLHLTVIRWKCKSQQSSFHLCVAMLFLGNCNCTQKRTCSVFCTYHGLYYFDLQTFCYGSLNVLPFQSEIVSQFCNSVNLRYFTFDKIFKKEIKN